MFMAYYVQQHWHYPYLHDFQCKMRMKYCKAAWEIGTANAYLKLLLFHISSPSLIPKWIVIIGNKYVSRRAISCDSNLKSNWILLHFTLWLQQMHSVIKSKHYQFILTLKIYMKEQLGFTFLVKQPPKLYRILLEG